MTQKIVFLGTGGTIAGRSSSSGDNVSYQAAQVGVDGLLSAIPLLKDALQAHELVAEQVAQVDSKDMGFEQWAALAQRTQVHLEDASVRAVVITHGTDTLEETAYFLSAVLPQSLLLRKAVVLTCAMRPASAMVPDGPQNVLDATVVALSGSCHGVLVVCAGQVHAAHEVQKIHTYQLNAFDSGDAGPVAVVEEGRVRCFRTALTAAAWKAPSVATLQTASWPRVEIVFNHAGASGSLVRAALSSVHEATGPVRGMVVAGTGNGSIHHDLERALRDAQAQGVRVVRASRCAYGNLIVGPHAQDALPHYAGLSAVKSRIALMLELMA
jgi:L-asparaginase